MKSKIRPFLLLLGLCVSMNVFALKQSSIDEKLDSAVQLYQAKKSEVAERLFREITKLEVSSVNRNQVVSALTYLSQITLERNQFLIAYEYLLKAERLLPGAGALPDSTLFKHKFTLVNYFVKKGVFNQALVHLREIPVGIMVSAVDSLELMSAFGKVHWYMHTFDSAGYYYRLNLRLANKLNKPQYLAKAYDNLGLLKGKKGHFDSASFYFLKANWIYQSSQEFQKELGLSYNYLGVVNMLRGNYSESRLYYEKSLKIKQATLGHNHISLADSYNNFGGLYSKVGEHSSSRTYHLKALEIRRNAFGEEHIDVAKSFNNIGLTYLNQGEYKLAIEYLHKAARLKKKFYNPIHLNTANTFLNIGKCYLLMNQLDSSGYYYQLAADIVRYFPDEKNVNSTVKEGIIILLAAQGKLEEALDKSKELLADKKIHFGKGSDKTVDSYSDVATIYLKLKKFDKAISYYDSALKFSASPDRSESIDLTGGYYALAGLGRSYFQLHSTTNETSHLTKCLDYYLKAEEYLKKRYRMIGVDDKLNSSKKEPWFYSETMNASFAYYQLSQDSASREIILEFMNEKNSNLTNELIRKQAFYQNGEDSLITREINILNELSGLRSKLKKSADNKAIKDQMFVLQRDFEEVKNNLQAKNANYYQVKYANQFISVSSLQNTLRPDEVVLQYQLTSENIFLMLIEKNSFQFIKKEIEPEFEMALNTVIKLINNPDFTESEKELKAFQTFSNILYRHLIAPVEGFLDQKELIIVPDELLYKLPFEVLVKNTDPVVFFSQLDYLIHQYTVSYCTSLEAFVNRRNENENLNTEMVLFARSFENNNEDGLPPIPYSLQEVGLIKQYLGKSSIYTDAMATETKFWQNTEGAKVMHIASHAQIDETDPFLSHIMLKGTPDNDGLIYGFELIGKQLNIDLISLSACHTGNSILIPGEGMLSLANGFFISGTRNIIMSLWNTNDASSATLLTDFYKSLSNGVSINKSLQLAKIAHINASPEVLTHPHYWAVYVLNGNNDYQQPRASLWWQYLLAGLLASVVLFFGIKYLIKK